MDQAIYEIQAEFCRAMGHSSRLRILHILQEGPRNVSELARQIGLPPATISRQLGILRSAAIVLCRRHGTEMIYQLSDAKIADVCSLVREVLSESPQRYARFMSE